MAIVSNVWHSWTKLINANPGENLNCPRFLHQLSDNKYFTNKYTSLGILAIDQTITVLKTKQISTSSSCLCIMISCRQNLCLQAMFNEKCPIHAKFNRNAKYIPSKIMILFAWSWSTKIIYSEVNNKIFVRPCWFLLCTFEMPVTESPTAVAVRTTLNWMILG